MSGLFTLKPHCVSYASLKYCYIRALKELLSQKCYHYNDAIFVYV
jgi:hypothetical protein